MKEKYCMVLCSDKIFFSENSDFHCPRDRSFLWNSSSFMVLKLLTFLDASLNPVMLAARFDMAFSSNETDSMY